MILKEINNILGRISDNVSSISGNRKLTEKKSLYSFKNKKNAYHASSLRSNIASLKSKISEKEADVVFLDKEILEEIRSLIEALDLDDISSVENSVKKIKIFVDKSTESFSAQKEDSPTELSISVNKNVPAEIRGDIIADLGEIDKCFSSGCYRSVAILCGRLLEVSLHWKYFQATGMDLLEKSPGIGLGKIVAKLSEKNVELDPGLSQQIHLINQVRVFSVHVKQQTFNPNKNQAHAMILYTSDILEKIFSK